MPRSWVGRSLAAVVAVLLALSLVAFDGGGGKPSGASVIGSHFPIGLYHVGFGVASDPNDDAEGAQLIADLEDIAAAGFNTVSAMPNEDDMVPFLTRAQQLGVDVIYSKDGTAFDWEDVLPSIRSFPSLVGVVHSDDVNTKQGPDFNYPLAQAKTDYAIRKQQAPNQAVYVSGGGHHSYGNLKRWAPYADIIGVQSYPICNEPDAKALSAHWAYMQRAFNRLTANGQPWYVNGQAFSWGGGCATRVPTLAEYRNMMFAALINGARGILNYTYFDAAGRLPALHPAFWNDIKTFNADIAAIEPFLVSGQLTRVPKLKLQAHAGYWRLGDDLLLVVIGTHRTKAASVTVQLPAGYTGALTTVLPGYATGLVNNGGTVSGAVAPDSVHVYRTTRS
jgi:hypothetical protein